MSNPKGPMHGNNPEAMQAMIDGLQEVIDRLEKRLDHRNATILVRAARILELEAQLEASK